MQRVERSIRVATSAMEAYTLWRNFQNFPQFMEHVDEVKNLDDAGKLSHWRLKGPLGVKVEFDSELTQDEPGRSIGWNSRDGQMGSTGNVTFTPTDDNTLVHVVMQWYDPPAGPIGEALSRLLQDPQKMLDEDLQRFKALAEERVASRQ